MTDRHDEHDNTQEIEQTRHMEQPPRQQSPPPQRESSQHVHDESARRDRVERRTVYRSTWSPAQVIALAAGIFFLVLGGVALARGGFENLTNHTSVGGFHHTPLLGIIEMALGLLMLGMGAIPGAERGGMTFTGALALAFGLVVAFQGESFHGVLGTHANLGWLYAIIGAVLLVAALVAPIILQQDGTVHERY